MKRNGGGPKKPYTGPSQVVSDVMVHITEVGGVYHFRMGYGEMNIFPASYKNHPLMGVLAMVIKEPEKGYAYPYGKITLRELEAIAPEVADVLVKRNTAHMFFHMG